MRFVKSLLCLAMTAMGLSMATYANSQTYPAKPIHLVVPFAPGGPADSSARMIASALTERLGQTVVVENRPGGGGVVAAKAVIAALPDGYTLFYGAPSTLSFTSKINPAITYDPLGAFAPISLTHVVPLFLIVESSTPASTLGEFIDYAKKRGGKLNFGSAGNGTTSHLCLEALKVVAGIEMTHIPFRGSAPAAFDLMAKRIDIMCDPYSSHRGNIEAGKLRVLAHAGLKRSSVLPSAPSAAESGLPDFEMTTWFAIMAPAGTPLDIRNRIAGAVADGQKTEPMQQKARAVGFDPVSSTPEETAEFIRREQGKLDRIVTTAGIKL